MSIQTTEIKTLCNTIREFLSTYAGITPDYRREGNVETGNKYTSPDAYQLEYAIFQLESKGFITDYPFADWGSGGFKPYSSRIGRAVLEQIMNDLKKYKK